MRIALISPYSDITSLGVRSLAAMLKKCRHDVRLIFIPENRPEITGLGDSWGEAEAEIIDQCAELVKDMDLVGMSLMSNYRVRAVHLTQGLKRIIGPETLFIWGGIHPTISPQECLHYSDGICLGEGEEALVELVRTLADGHDHTAVPNFWFNHGQTMVRNPVRPLIRELDTLPYPDYTLTDDHVYSFESNCFQKMDQPLLKASMSSGYISGIRQKVAYQTIATRGCPHNCTYCCNNSLRELYGGKNYLRRRSIGNIIGELQQVRSRHPFIEEIGFSDDSFFAASAAEIKEFASIYKREIGLPFFCLGSPTTITREKMEALSDAGMYGIQMGIQSGSGHTQKLYKRNISNEKILEAARILNSFNSRMIPPTFDVIIDNPYERPDDCVETFRLLLRLPRPHHIQVFSLVLFPETELYRAAIRDGFLEDSKEMGPIKEYHHRRGNYCNVVFALFARNAPRPLLHLLSWQPVVRLMSSPVPRLVIETLYRWYRVIKRAGEKGPGVKIDKPSTP